jgi:hypothetical protein
MSDVTRALEQIAEIHDHLARGEVYRGWRSLPVALSGLVGLAGALWQSMYGRPIEPWSFTMYWAGVASVSLAVGCSEIAWRYARATPRERRQTRCVIGQFLPALVAGAIATTALLRLSSALVALFPGLWALLYGVAIFAARPYIPRVSGWVALYFWTAGLLLLWTANGIESLSPWSVGATFGIGQLFGALALYWNLERETFNDDETRSD